jgi:arginase
MMNSVFTMVVPQWQGAAAGTGPFYGAQKIEQMLGSHTVDAHIHVNEQSVTKQESGVWYEYEIEKHLKQSINLLHEKQPKRVFTIGGDCASDTSAISYLNNLYEGDLLVLWFDAHADLNTPASSCSHKFHGMPLRLLLGEGVQNLLNLLPSTLHTNQILFTGLRELEHSERQFIVDHAMPNVPICHECSSLLGDVVAKTGYRRLYLHLDLDVINPLDFDAVACPSPGGFWFNDLVTTIRELGEHYEIVGCAVTEYQPKNDDDAQKVKILVEAVHEALSAN